VGWVPSARRTSTATSAGSCPVTETPANPGRPYGKRRRTPVRHSVNAVAQTRTAYRQPPQRQTVARRQSTS
jgi:hypothetical protein